MSKHTHAEIIKAWADGAKIQYFNTMTNEYRDCVNTPKWDADTRYRVKPQATRFRVAEFGDGKLDIIYSGEFDLVQGAPAFKRWVTDVYEVSQ